MTDETKLLQRYFDGELSPAEAEQFRALLSDRPQLRRELRDMQRVGALVRSWSRGAEETATELVAPTLRRIEASKRRRSACGALACGLALGLLALRGSHAALPTAPHVEHLEASHFLTGAAIERVEATHQQAQVFVVGRTSTPVVWLEDDAQEEDGPPEQDPG